MSRKEWLYEHAPGAAQQLMCDLEGLRIQRFRYGGSFPVLLGKAIERDLWNAEKLAEYRERMLAEYVRHAAETVPYYRQLFKELGIDPWTIRTVEDLSRLPILTKAEIQQNPHAFVSEAVALRDRLMAHTSGSTGAGLVFASTRTAHQAQWAVWWRYRMRLGLRQGTWCAYFGGRSLVSVDAQRPPFWRYNRPGRQILFSGYHMSPANMPAYAAELKKRRAPWIHGYPSLLVLLADYLVSSGASLGYEVKWVTVGAENLLDHQSALIQRAFGVAPRQHYGQEEGVANMSECEKGCLHVDEDFSAVEFIPRPDGSFQIVGTNFTNPATPLLRYDTGDVAVLSSKSCECGRGGRVIERLDGREEDYVVLRNGARLGRVCHIFRNIPRIREAQVRQDKPGQVCLNIVKNPGYSETDERALLNEAQKYLGSDTEISVRYCDSLQRAASGKLRFVVSAIASSRCVGA